MKINLSEQQRHNETKAGPELVSCDNETNVRRLDGPFAGFDKRTATR